MCLVYEGTLKVQREEMDPQKLELQVVVSYPTWVSGIWTQFLWNSGSQPVGRDLFRSWMTLSQGLPKAI